MNVFYFEWFPKLHVQLQIIVKKEINILRIFF